MLKPGKVILPDPDINERKWIILKKHITSFPLGFNQRNLAQHILQNCIFEKFAYFANLIAILCLCKCVPASYPGQLSGGQNFARGVPST